MYVMEGEESQGSKLALNLAADDIDASAADATGLGFGLGEEGGGLEVDWDQLFFHEVDRCLSPGFSFTNLLDLQSPPSPEILEHQLQPSSQLLPHSSPSSISSSPKSLISLSSMDNFQVHQNNHPNPHTSIDGLPAPPTQDFQVVRAPTVMAAQDPVSRKRIRQMRNRDAAVRSRERKKLYIRDLEMKSRHLEGECRRLNRLLQCCYAENHSLRLTRHLGNAYCAPMAKQESAVLLMESLLLGSLLWFLGIICLLILPTIPVLLLPVALLRNLEGLERMSVCQRVRNEILAYWVQHSFALNRKYKGSRVRIKSCLLVI